LARALRSKTCPGFLRDLVSLLHPPKAAAAGGEEEEEEEEEEEMHTARQEQVQKYKYRRIFSTKVQILAHFSVQQYKYRRIY
jgi:hypothetical protein